jgi:hypothetical protein
MRLSLSSSGSFKNTEDFFKRMGRSGPPPVLQKFGEAGIAALASATPKETGETAISWDYRVSKHRRGYTVEWFNSNVNEGANIAVLIQYGHGTGTGGYVAGIDYINPTMRPIFEGIIAEIWREVTK